MSAFITLDISRFDLEKKLLLNFHSPTTSRFHDDLLNRQSVKWEFPPNPRIYLIQISINNRQNSHLLGSLVCWRGALIYDSVRLGMREMRNEPFIFHKVALLRRMFVKCTGWAFWIFFPNWRCSLRKGNDKISYPGGSEIIFSLIKARKMFHSHWTFKYVCIQKMQTISDLIKKYGYTFFHFNEDPVSELRANWVIISASMVKLMKTI